MTTTRMRALAGALALVAVGAPTATATAAPADAAPAAQAAARRARAPRSKTCDVSAVSIGADLTSVTSLKVTGVSCDGGIAVVRAFHACRLANGPSGRCVRKVRGWACIETRTNAPMQFSATATCKKDSASIVHRYTQVV